MLPTHPFISIGDKKMNEEQLEKLCETIEGITSELKEIKYYVNLIREKF